jgi:hypothetical protein
MIATGADAGCGSIGSNTYQASGPEPPDDTRESWWDRSLLPGPAVGCAGCVIVAPLAATVDGGNGGRGGVGSEDDEAVVLACVPFDDDEHPAVAASTATTATRTTRFTTSA